MSDPVDLFRSNAFPVIQWEDFATMRKGTVVGRRGTDASNYVYAFDRFDPEEGGWWSGNDNLWHEYEGPFYLVAPAPEPVLPTEPGRVILAGEVRGRKFEPRSPLVLGTDGYWRGEDADGWFRHTPKHIKDWVPAKVVPE